MYMRTYDAASVGRLLEREVGEEGVCEGAAVVTTWCEVVGGEGGGSETTEV